MAKRKPRWQPPAASDGKAMTLTPFQTDNTIKPPHRSSKRGVARAQEKHQHDTFIRQEPPTLADRFHALPTELRNHIFSFVLVQPVKWDIAHAQDCPHRTSNGDLTPEVPWTMWNEPCNCASRVNHWTHWRKDINHSLDIWVSPWRSKWAPEQRNPYVCTKCYDARLRARPFPSAVSLPCLCARRQNLEVLLVCKKWYLEAGQKFYTSNTFAFEDHTTFVNFTENLNPYWLSKISKISLMALSPWTLGDTNMDSTDPNSLISNNQWAKVWSQLRKLPSLTTLELDANLLKNEKLVFKMLKLGLRNVRQVRFVARLPHNEAWNAGSEHIWPALEGRQLLEGGFPGEVGRAIKGQKESRVFKEKKNKTELMALAEYARLGQWETAKKVVDDHYCYRVDIPDSRAEESV